MKKSQVLNHFGGTTPAARAIGVSKSTVSLWGETIPWQYALLIAELTEGDMAFRREDYPTRFSKGTPRQ
ncbi:Cro/CI family transcriptional regulator [Yokenella regensburgei]|jgi:hypothetical protein|uniref:Cro/CI family transcriptional regulator n=1 Tax=Yokenella regensburgei TaxID=158877 RepID=UPI0014329867|nr:Cro/CI family transcriptional regulator [Yokenella regensburgei]QIU88470.1 hypothetical protein HEC60_03430 [Yokenella regensburgei]